jgi:hypothetical protein
MSNVGEWGRGLFRFRWDCGRQGYVEGIFTAEKKDVEAAIGKHVSFGEILGKHSDIYGTIEEGEITLLTDDEPFVTKFDELNLETGYNPLNFITKDE